MTEVTVGTFDVAKALVDARAAFEKGALAGYTPLKAVQSGAVHAPSMTSWGPMMKR